MGTSQPSVSLGTSQQMGTSQPSVSLGDKWVPVNPVCLWVTKSTQGDKPVNPVCLWVSTQCDSLGDKWVPVNPVCLWVTNGYQSTQCVFG